MICNVTKNIDSIADHIKDYVTLRISGRATGNLGLFDGDGFKWLRICLKIL